MIEKTDPFQKVQREEFRIQMTVSCTDCQSIPKVPHAGEVFDGPKGWYQLMHNGVKIIKDCYGGPYSTEIIKRLHGCHEPQEEKAFYEILDYIPENATMIELGSYWSYYSLWFQNRISTSINYMIEPDPNNLEVGKKNFDLNGMKGYFHHAAIGKESRDSIPFSCESDNVIRQIPIISIDDFVAREGIKNVELLLCDIQGFELEMLEGATKCLEQGIIRFVVISTHHHLISNDPLMHQRCLNFLDEHEAHILVEHNIAESFSGDGLIVASFRSEDSNLPTIEVSRNHPANSLFREVEYDLVDIQAERDKISSDLVGVQAERDKISSNLVGVQAERDKISSNLVGVQAERDMLSSELVGVQAERDQYSIVVDHVYHSHSWRITAPLRALFDTTHTWRDKFIHLNNRIFSPFITKFKKFVKKLIRRLVISLKKVLRYFAPGVYIRLANNEKLRHIYSRVLSKRTAIPVASNQRVKKDLHNALDTAFQKDLERAVQDWQLGVRVDD